MFFKSSYFHDRLFFVLGGGGIKLSFFPTTLEGTMKEKLVNDKY